MLLELYIDEFIERRFDDMNKIGKYGVISWA